MLQTYLKITLRNLWKNKTYSFINIFGLSIGIACAILILLWVRNELNYDKFHSKAENIYRVVQHDNNGMNSRAPAPLAPVVAEASPAVTAYARLFKPPRLVIEHGENIFYENEGIIVDPAFLTMFDFTLIQGDRTTALNNPDNIVLTESMVEKYFGDVDPLNKSVVIDGEGEMIVTGILEDIPQQSHLQFEFLISSRLLEFINPRASEDWGGFNYTTYFLLRDDADIAQLTGQMNQIAEERIPPPVLPFWDEFSLQPLSQIHLSADIANTQFLGNFTIVEDRNTVYMFVMIAFFILALACINFMNLSTARSGTRTREIGMKKVTGASRGQLVRQFLGEFFLLSLIAFGLGLLLAELALPWFNQISGKALTLEHTRNVIPYASIILVTTLLGGFYPAIYLSSFNPLMILKRQVHRSPKARKTRSVLVVFQFAISIVLIAGTVIVYSQLQFVQNKKLGFDKENIVYVNLGGNILGKYPAMKEQLLSHSGITGVTAKDCLPTEARRTLVDFFWDTKGPDQEVLMEYTGVDYGYFDMLNIEFAKGRAFSEDFSTDATGAFILNEEAVRQTGIKDPVGKNFASWNKKGTIVGIIKNTNFKSLHQQVNPQVYHVLNDLRPGAELNTAMLLKINGTNQRDALAFVGDTWEQFNPNTPFEYHFLDQEYEKLYLADRRTRTVINYFSGLAILIACLGLYGLAAFTAEKRRKEIGIRKTLGANIETILSTFTGDFAKLVLVANLIAWPVAWYAMHRWLQNFAYHIDMTIWPFVLAGITALVIALLTVSWQAVRAATANPVESLRYE